MSDEDVLHKEDDALREHLGGLLRDGLETEWQTRAYSSEQVNAVVARLRAVAKDDYKQKLIIAGFTDHPYDGPEIAEACDTCMYYLIHRKYCELPELDVPVEPEWSCNLWRI